MDTAREEQSKILKVSSFISRLRTVSSTKKNSKLINSKDNSITYSIVNLRTKKASKSKNY